MKKTKIQGIYKDKNLLFTINQNKGVKIYNEKILRKKGEEYRSWNPYRSKLSAAIKKGLEIDIKPNHNILYLGAATGTTVSHISDILLEGMVYAVENSAVALKELIKVCENRENIAPIFSDAFHPDRYSSIVSKVDIVYQDISQRNQAEIFVKNINQYLKKDGIGIIMVKARSIDVSLKPKKAFELVVSYLKDNSLKIVEEIDISSFEKDHEALIVKK